MIPDGEEAIGVNQRAELARAAAVLRRRKLNQLMLAGVSIVDPAATWIDMDVEVGRDAVIEPGCVIQGATRIGERVHLKPGCTIESSEIGDDAVIGPNAHLRPGTRLGRNVRIGNFVEVKNSVLGEGVKADHLSYIGDADVGAGASFGCGSIVVNYDGIAKHRTQVGPRAFIGCNANLVAPLRIAEDAFVAAGSTITKDVPALALAVARGKQQNVEGWVKRRRARGTPAHGAAEAQAPAVEQPPAKRPRRGGAKAKSRSARPRASKKSRPRSPRAAFALAAAGVEHVWNRRLRRSWTPRDGRADRRPAASRVPGLRLGGGRDLRPGRDPRAPRARQAREPRGQSCATSRSAGSIGIGHTRWATHGKPSERNAHPHRAGGVVVVHNGIIENYRKLRQEFEAAGRTMASDTDTELIAHLIDVEIAAGKDLLAASRAACGRLEGSYAFAVLSTRRPRLHRRGQERREPDHPRARREADVPRERHPGDPSLHASDGVPRGRRLRGALGGRRAGRRRRGATRSSASPSRSSGIRSRRRRAATTASCRRRSSSSRARSWTRSGRAWSSPRPTSTSTGSTSRASSTSTASAA